MPECPSELQLCLYTERALPEGETQALREHILTCPCCAEVLEKSLLLQDMDEAGILPDVAPVEVARAVDVVRGLAGLAANTPEAWLQKFFKGCVNGITVLNALQEIPTLASDVRLVLTTGDRSQIADHLCALRCEYIVLKECGVEVDEEVLFREAVANGWFDPDRGTPLDCLGRLLELHGLRVERRCCADMDAVREALRFGHSAIAAVDSGELMSGGLLSTLWETVEDFLVQVPDHCLMILGTETDADGREFVIVGDPAGTSQRASVPLEDFLDAWADSENFLLVAYKDEQRPLL